MHLHLRKTSYGRYEELSSLNKCRLYVLGKAIQTGCTQKGLCRTQPRRIFSSYVNLDWDIYIDRIYRIKSDASDAGKIIPNCSPFLCLYPSEPSTYQTDIFLFSFNNIKIAYHKSKIIIKIAVLLSTLVELYGFV